MESNLPPDPSDKIRNMLNQMHAEIGNYLPTIQEQTEDQKLKDFRLSQRLKELEDIGTDLVSREYQKFSFETMNKTDEEIAQISLRYHQQRNPGKTWEQIGPEGKN